MIISQTRPILTMIRNGMMLTLALDQNPCFYQHLTITYSAELARNTALVLSTGDEH